MHVRLLPFLPALSNHVIAFKSCFPSLAERLNVKTVLSVWDSPIQYDNLEQNSPIIQRQSLKPLRQWPFLSSSFFISSRLFLAAARSSSEDNDDDRRQSGANVTGEWLIASRTVTRGDKGIARGKAWGGCGAILLEITNYFDKNSKNLILSIFSLGIPLKNQFFWIFVKMIGSFRLKRAFLCKIYSFQHMLVCIKKKSFMNKEL